MNYTATGTMPAIVQDRYGESSQLRRRNVAIPAPTPGQVRVRVRAVSLNPADKFIMRGSPRMIRLVYGLTRPRRPVRGHDFAGVVDAVGDSVTEFTEGDEVFGEFDGVLAEFACGHVDRIAPVPPTTTFEDAAALPMAGLAALAAVRAANVTAGTRLLINGASGGIGTFAIQIAKARGAHVTAVCSTRNVELVRSLGADEVIDYLTAPLTRTEDRFDVILDNVGNHRMRDLLPLLRGRGTLLPNTGEPGPDGGAIMRVVKAQVLNMRFKHRVATFTSGPSRADLEELGRMVANGALRPVIDTMFDFDHAADAMARLATGHARGKVVVTLPGE